MSLGLTPTQSSVFTTTEFCDGRVAPDSALATATAAP